MKQTIRHLVLLAGLTLGGTCLSSASDDSPATDSENQLSKEDPSLLNSNYPIGMVNGIVVTRRALTPWLENAQNTEIQAQEMAINAEAVFQFYHQKNAQATEALMDEMMAEQADSAAAMETAGTPPDVVKKALLYQEIMRKQLSTVPLPTDADLRANYDQNSGTFNKPFDEVKAQLADSLTQSWQSKHIDEWIDAIRQHSDIKRFSLEPIEWKALNKRSFQHLQILDYPEATQLAQQALAVAEADPEQTHVVKALYQLGRCYEWQKDYTQATSFYQRALAIEDKRLGADHPDLLKYLYPLAKCYSRQGAIAKLESIRLHILDINEKKYGLNHPTVASDLVELAALYRHTNREAEALKLEQRIEVLRRPALARAKEEDIRKEIEQSKVFLMLGNHNDAIASGHKALDIAEAYPDAQQLNVAECLENLASTYMRLGDYAKAEPLFKRALTIREEAQGPTHTTLTDNLLRLATVYRNTNRENEATALEHRVEEIKRPPPPPEEVDANTLHQQSVQLLSKGDTQQAIQVALQALADEKATPNQPRMVRALYQLAKCYTREGDYFQAEPHLEQVVVVSEKKLGPDHPNMRQHLNALTTCYNHQGKYAEAEPLLKRILAINEQQHGPDDQSVVRALNNLSVVYLKQGDYPKAEPLLQRALAILNKTEKPDPRSLDRTLNLLAQMYVAQKDYTQAEPLYLRILDIRIAQHGSDHHTVAETRKKLDALPRATPHVVEVAPVEQQGASTQNVEQRNPQPAAPKKPLSASMQSWALKAEKGDMDAQFFLAFRCANAKDYERAFKWYTKAAAQGDSIAQHRLGKMCQKGEGVAQDSKEAVKWYTMAAAQGLARSQFSLGLMYYHGNGVAEDRTKATEYYERAAKQGVAEAQYHLGMSYYHGQGVPQDQVAAAKWLTKSAHEEFAPAQDKLALLYFHGEGLQQDVIEAYAWALRAFLNDVPETKETILEGLNTEQAAAGRARAGQIHFDIGKRYYYGDRVGQNKREAAKWYTKAASLGHAQAQSYLAVMYYQKSEGLKQNYVKAYAWSLRAASNGATEAQEILAEELTPKQRAGGQVLAKQLALEAVK